MGTVSKPPVRTVSFNINLVSNSKPVKTVRVDPGCCVGRGSVKKPQ